ncbi:MAG: molybdenum cofactor biosynthesis protein, partial [Rhodospirillaceae bacterium]|nr:molybdenum cofactor biosynthesis protein [Rhodospirillaceae bacterium]
MSKIEGERDFLSVNIAVLTVSDSRTLEDDKSGMTLVQRIEDAGHTVAARDIVKDEVALIVAKLNGWIADENVDVGIATGATGGTGRDITPEALAHGCEKRTPGFGEWLRWRSFQQMATSTIQSRAPSGGAG